MPRHRGTARGLYRINKSVKKTDRNDSMELAASFGVAPRIRESAETSHNCGTTHRGDEQARRLLKQAVFVHVSNVEDSVVTKMYNRLKSRGKAHNEVLIACARKLLTVVWSVLKNRLPYTDDAGLLARATETEARMEVEGTE